MATAVRRRRGTTDQHQVFIGLVGEITVDTDKDTIVIHDGETTGGFPIAREDLSNVSSADITNTIGVGGLGRDKIAPATADNVVINNGSGELSSEPQLAITRGGTGAGNIVDARNNLGLGTMATQNASFVNITGGSITGIDPISITSGGTSATNAADARTNLGAVNIAGDTITGNLRIGTGVGSIELGIDGGTGDDRILAYYSNGIKRWEVRVNAEPETGGNTGSDFRISRFDDLGSFIDAPFNIDREDGKITLGNAVEFSNSITFSAPISISQGGTGANNAADARTNLGLGTLAVQDANSVAITGGSISGITPIAIADGGTGASTPSGARTNLGAVNIAGDTMTGDLTVGDTLESSAIIVTGEDGFIREFRLATLSSPRWSLGTDSSTETGSNAGSNFTITRSDDAGSAIDVPFSIARDTGEITLNADVVITGNTSLGGLTLDGILAINDGGTGADTAEGARVNLNVVNRSGDTMTGDLTVGSGIASSSIRVNGIGESIRSLSYLSEGFQRWSLITDATPEGAPSGVQYLKVTDPVQLPTGTGFGIAFAPTVSHLAVAHSSSPHVTIYEETGGVFNKLSDPAIEPPGSGLGVAFSPNSTYLAVTHLTSPRLTVYKRSGNTYTKLPDPADLPPDIAWKPAFSPDGNFLAVAHTTSPFVTIYQRSGDTLTKLPDPGTIPAGGANSVAFSPDSVHMAVAHAIAPWLTIYSISGTTFTKLPDPVNTPTGEGEGVAFSPNGLFMAVAHSNTPFVTIYSRSGDVFTKVADPAILPTDDAQSVAFSSNGSLFSVAHVASPFATNYVIDGTTFTKIADPATLPAGTGNGIGYAPDSNFMAVAHVNSPFVTIYDVDEITPDIGSDFRIRRHDDQGVLIDSLVTIERSTGDITLSGTSTFTQDLTVNGTVTFDVPLSVSSGGTGADNPTDARTNLGLGSISTQDASNISITGGSITGITDLAIADGGTGASTAADARTNLGAVNIAGDTMTGDLIVDGSAAAAITVDGDDGFTRSFNFRTLGSPRWSILASDDSEVGGNTGSDFVITRNDDSGLFINAPITIVRDTGNITLDATSTTVTGNLQVLGTISIASPLPVTEGGTGASTASGARTNLGLGTASTPTFTGLSANGAKITNVATPTNAGDAANRAYVDSVAIGLRIVESVQVATVDDLDTVGNGIWVQSGAGVGATLTAGAVGTTTIDGYTLQLGDRVLIKDQITESENGIYVASSTGAGAATVLTRATDLDEPSEFENAFTFVAAGTANSGSSWATTAPFPTIVDTDPVEFVQFAGPATLAGGGGIDLTANVISVDLATDSGLIITSDELAVDPAIAGTGLTFTSGVLSVNASQTQITAVGTLTTGTWNANTITIGFGGTGATSAAGARTNLGVAIGSNVQAWDAGLDDISGLAVTDGNFIVGDGTNWVAESGVTARTSLGLGTIATQNASNVSITGGSITGITDLAIADGGTGASTASTARSNLGVAIGSDVQAWDVNLDQIAALIPTDSNFIVGNGSAWITESGVTARTSLGLGTIATQNASGVAITGGSITGITDLAIADGGTGASTAAGARTNLGAVNIAGDTMTGDLTVPGLRFTEGFRVGRTTTAVSYSTLVTDFIVSVTDLSISRVITLVSAATIGAGGMQIIKDETGAAGGPNSITVNASGGQTIDGAASVEITANYGVIRLYSDGSNWFSI